MYIFSVVTVQAFLFYYKDKKLPISMLYDNYNGSYISKKYVKLTLTEI